jgi:hypothetical protein
VLSTHSTVIKIEMEATDVVLLRVPDITVRSMTGSVDKINAQFRYVAKFSAQNDSRRKLKVVCISDLLPPKMSDPDRAIAGRSTDRPVALS